MENQLIDENLVHDEKTPVTDPDFKQEIAETDEDDAEATDAEDEGEIAPPDYGAMAEADLLAVRRLSPAYAELGSLAELPDAERFGELRELGLSVSEALGALGLLSRGHDSRSHLRTSVPRRIGDGGVRMSASELESARRLFPGLGEREIARLYRRVNQ